MTTIRNIILGFLITIVSIIIFWFLIFKILIFIADKIFDLPESSKTELIENFEKNEKQIGELKEYFNSIVSSDKKIFIEFESDKEIRKLWLIYPYDTIFQKSYINEYDLIPGSSKIDSILKVIGWTNENLKSIKSFLDKANCISVENGEPCKIGFKRSGLGKYYYEIFKYPIPDSLHKTYNNGCEYIQYNDKTVLEYEGGAIGPYCFPDP